MQPCSLALLPLEDMKALKRFHIFSKGRSNVSERGGGIQKTDCSTSVFFESVVTEILSVNVLQHLLVE